MFHGIVLYCTTVAIKVSGSKQTLFHVLACSWHANLPVYAFPACQLCKMCLLECILSLEAFRKRGISRATLMEGTQNHGKARGEEENLNCEKLQCSGRETFSFSFFPFVLGVNEGIRDLL
jgi:hypothetical protein